MVNPKYHNNVVLDINTRLTNSSADEDKKLEDHMKRLDEEFQRQQAQISKVAKKWYLSHFKGRSPPEGRKGEGNRRRLHVIRAAIAPHDR